MTSMITTGWTIPKESTIIANVWWGHSSVLYKSCQSDCRFRFFFFSNSNSWFFCYPRAVSQEVEDPEKFMPERWLETDPQKIPPDPASYVFGFGRRWEFVENHSHHIIRIKHYSENLFIRVFCAKFHTHCGRRNAIRFNIPNARGNSGHENVPEIEYDGFIGLRYIYATSALERSTVTHFGANC